MNNFSPENEFFSGIIVYNTGSRFGPRIQTDLQLVTVHEGEVRVDVDGQPHHLSAGEATLLLPGHEEFFQFSEQGQTRHGWCGIHRPSLEVELTTRLEALPFRHAFTPRMRELEAMFLPLRESISPGDQQLHGILVQAMLVEFLNQAGVLEEATLPHHPALIRATAFMEANFQDSIDLPAIAAKAGVSPAHLIRLFTEQLNTTPKAHLWRIRNKAAARLLKSTGLSAAEIAYQCGFANPHHFSRLFHKHFGLPPRAWRLREWGR